MASAVRMRSFEMRAKPDEGEGVVEGYVTTFGNDYDIGWGMRERIDPAAFDESMAQRDNVLPIMYQHDHRQPPIGVATLTRDAHGILARVQLFMEDARARATWLAMKAGALREWSIGFTAESTDIDRVRQDGNDVEVIKRGDLMEASVVLRGANDQTSTLSVRAEGKPEDKGEVEPPAAPPVEPLHPRLLEQIDKPWVRELLRAQSV